MNILILNGPNLNLLGSREPEIYGRRDEAALVRFLSDCCRECGVSYEFHQSNREDELVERIQQAPRRFDAIVLNPAAFTHTSVAILDALRAAELPAVEVHLSDVGSREPFRRISYPGQACVRTFAGRGFESYRDAIRFLSENK